MRGARFLKDAGTARPFVECAAPALAAHSTNHSAIVPLLHHGDDLWALVGRELHLRYANGAGRATVNHEALTRRLGVSATARNFRTVAKIIALSE